MKNRILHGKHWLSLILFTLLLCVAVPTFALPYRWYSKIYVTKNPDKMVYEIGESFDKTGMDIHGDCYDANGNFVSSNSLGLDDKYFSFSPKTFTKAGKQKVTLGLHCMGKSGSREWLYTSITVTVNEEGDGPSEWYTDIFVANPPKKTTYVVGESFKTSGLSLSAHVFNALEGKKHVVKNLSLKDLKVSPSKFTKAGKQNVKVSLYLLDKDGKYKWFSTTIPVDVQKGVVSITKHPTSETVGEGGSCGFTAKGKNETSRHWFFFKNSTVVDASHAAASFPGLTISGVTKETLKLSNIPLSLNGWSVYCVFEGEDSAAASNMATITVVPKYDAATPTPIVTPVPTATPTPAAPGSPTPTPDPNSLYAEGLHCTVNGQTRVALSGDTALTCEAEKIDGFVFDHWEVNGEPDYTAGETAVFHASTPTVIRACYHQRRVVQAINCYFQLLTAKNNALGEKYTMFDFEEAYQNPNTKQTCPGGKIDFYITAQVPAHTTINYWLINGVKYEFVGNVIKFRVLELDEATTFEVVFKNQPPVNQYVRPENAAELEARPPHLLQCINCWAQFMDASRNPGGESFVEFDFEADYVNPVTQEPKAGGWIDVFVSTEVPRGNVVDTWLINDVKYQFPITVTKFRVTGLDEATTYEVLFRKQPSRPDPVAGRR